MSTNLKTTIMVDAAALLVLMLHVSVDPDFVSLSVPLEHRYTGGGYRDELFQYRLFTPRASDTSQKHALIVWLHGKCESNRDNIAHLKWLDQFIFRPPWDKGRYPFFLLAVQCPDDNSDWTRRASETQDDMVEVVARILGRTLVDYPIDRNRVYLSGVSSGGTGSWELAIRYPELFSAVAPLGSDGGDNAHVAMLTNTPVWAFHCSRDAQTPVNLVRATVETLKSAGGVVHLTEVDSEKHDCWNAAFSEYHLLDWLLAQRRGQSSLAPGTIPLGTRLSDFAKTWQWWQVLVQLGVPAVLLLAVWNAVRRRARIARTRPVAT